MIRRPKRVRCATRLLWACAVFSVLSAQSALTPATYAQREACPPTILTIDRSGSMGDAPIGKDATRYLGLDANRRLQRYVERLLFEGFDGTVDSRDSVVVDAREDQGAILAPSCCATTTVFAWAPTSVGEVCSVDGLRGVWPASVPEYTDFAAVAEAVCTYSDQVPDGVYWVCASDETPEDSSGFPDDQRERTIRLRASYSWRPVLAIRVTGSTGYSAYLTIYHVQSYHRALGGISQVIQEIEKLLDEIAELRGTPTDMEPETNLAKLREIRDLLDTVANMIVDLEKQNPTEAVRTEIEELKKLLAELTDRWAVLCTPDAFNLVSPEAGAVVSQGEVRFSWSAANRASSYRLMLRRQGVDLPTTELTGTEHSLVLDPGDLEWTVQATGCDTDHFAQAAAGWRSLKVAAAAIVEPSSVPSDTPTAVVTAPPTATPIPLVCPAPFASLSPSNNEMIKGAEVLLRWEPSVGATEYKVTLAPVRAPRKEPIVLRVAESQALVALDTGAYDWSVQAFGPAGCEPAAMSNQPLRFRFTLTGPTPTPRQRRTTGPAPTITNGNGDHKPPWGIFLILLLLGGGLGGWFYLRRSLTVKLSRLDLENPSDERTFAVEQGENRNRIYLSEREGMPHYYAEAAARDHYLERRLLGWYLCSQEDPAGQKVRLGEKINVKRNPEDPNDQVDLVLSEHRPEKPANPDEQEPEATENA